MKLKLDRIISIATLFAALLAIILVLKKTGAGGAGTGSGGNHGSRPVVWATDGAA